MIQGSKSHLTKEPSQEAVLSPPALFAGMKEEIIKTRLLTPQRRRLRPREGRGSNRVTPQVSGRIETGPQVSGYPSRPVLSQLLIISLLGAAAPVALSSASPLSPIFGCLGLGPDLANLHFIDKETEVQRGKGLARGPHSVSW